MGGSVEILNFIIINNIYTVFRLRRSCRVGPIRALRGLRLRRGSLADTYDLKIVQVAVWCWEQNIESVILSHHCPRCDRRNKDTSVNTRKIWISGDLASTAPPAYQITDHPSCKFVTTGQRGLKV